MAIALKRSEIRENLLAFFEEEGKVLNIREYNEAFKAGRAPYPLPFLQKHLGNYKRVVNMLQRQEAARIAAIGSVKEEYPPLRKPVLEPAEETDLSPLEKLRAATGESSE